MESELKPLAMAIVTPVRANVRAISCVQLTTSTGRRGRAVPPAKSSSLHLMALARMERRKLAHTQRQGSDRTWTA
jgi:hypothetical protein